MKLIKLVILISFIGCSTIKSQEIEGAKTVSLLQDLLKQGWELSLVNNKILLIKQTEDGLLIEDVFEVLEDKDNLF